MTLRRGEGGTRGVPRRAAGDGDAHPVTVTADGDGPAPRQLRPTEVKRLNRRWRQGTRTRLALLLDSVTGPFNVGSILRSAAAFGVEHVWLCGNTAPLEHALVRKTALGALRFLTWERVSSPAAAARAAASAGWRVVALELASGAIPLHEAPLDGDVCLAVGNEDHGCSPALLASAHAVVYIPLVGRVGSLNVAVAAAIAMAETRRRGWMDMGGRERVAAAAEPTDIDVSPR